jgi:protein-tyrosine phosphatase
MTTGRIDVHSHLLPGVDDGCQSLDESLDCARRLVAAGYTHSFCTPHVWPNLPQNSVEEIPRRVAQLQTKLANAQIPLTLIPGGEINLRLMLDDTPQDQIVTFAMQRKFALIDLWADQIPDYFEPRVKKLQSFGLQVILAHPERMRAVHDSFDLCDYFTNLGLLLQGNLQCFTADVSGHTRAVAQKYLRENRYSFLGSDLHNRQTLDSRLHGLALATQLVGEENIDELTIINPRRLL